MLGSTAGRLKTGSMLHILWIWGLFVSPALASGPPSFRETESSATAVEGQTAVLPCSIENLGDSKVSWRNRVQILTRGREKFIDDPRVELSTDGDSKWNLVLHRVQLEDKGEYTCSILTKSFIQTLTMELNVVAPARILDTTPSEIVSVEEGIDILLTCNVTGSPSPQVTWSRYDVATGYERPASLCDRTAQSGSSGERLLVHGITRGCGGFYRCSASNGIAGESSRRMFVTVQSNERPQPNGKLTVTLPNKRVRGVLGQDAELECIVSSPIIASNYVWLHRGSVLRNNERYMLAVYSEGEGTITLALTVRDVQAEDYGTYTCLATNVQGCDKGEVELYED